MPELPDVEGFRSVLAEHGAGRRVQRVEVDDTGRADFDRALGSGRHADLPTDPSEVGRISAVTPDQHPVTLGL